MQFIQAKELILTINVVAIDCHLFIITIYIDNTTISKTLLNKGFSTNVFTKKEIYFY